jgi:hypothetical protein
VVRELDALAGSAVIIAVPVALVTAVHWRALGREAGAAARGSAEAAVGAGAGTGGTVSLDDRRRSRRVVG